MGLRMDVFRQRVGVGRFQLGDLAPVENFAREFVALFCELIEDRGGGGPCTGLGLLAAGQSHLAEKDIADLLRAAGIDVFTGDLADFGFEPRSGLGEIAGQSRQHLPVDGDAAPLHASEHADQRPLQCFIDGVHALGDEARLQHAPQPQDHIRILGGIGRGLVDGDLIECQPALAAADETSVVGRGMAKPSLGQRVAVVPASSRVQRIGDQLRIFDAAQGDAMLREENGAELDVETDLEERFGFE